MNSLCPGDKIFNRATFTAAPPGERGDLTRNHWARADGLALWAMPVSA